MRTTRSEPVIVRAWSRVIALDGGTSNTRALDIETAEAGARATQGQGLERAAFLVRVAALLGTMSPEQLASFWVGAVVADDVGHLARHPILARSPPVWMGGREPLRSLYARRLAGLLEGPVAPLDDELSEAASALGALAVVLVSIDPGSERSVNRH